MRRGRLGWVMATRVIVKAAMVKAALLLLAGGTPGTALAQDGPADPAPAPERSWTLSASGGVTAIADQADQPFVSLGLTRDFGGAWVRLDGTWIGSGDARGLTIPADTWIGTLSAGTYAGSLGLDGYVSLGSREFDPAGRRTAGGQEITLDRSGGLFAVGASVNYDLALTPVLFLSPYAGVDYTRIDFATAIIGPGGATIGSSAQASDGVTGTAGASLARLLAGNGGSVALWGALSTASNIAAVGQLGFANRAGAGTPRIADNPDEGGTWGELGASVSLNASTAVAIDLSAIQTVSFPFGDSTAALVGLRLRF